MTKSTANTRVEEFFNEIRSHEMRMKVGKINVTALVRNEVQES